MVRSGIGARMVILLKTSPVECIASINQVLAMLLGSHVGKFKQENAAKKGNTIPTPSVTLPASNVATKSNIGEKSKLSLSKSLQSALKKKNSY